MNPLTVSGYLCLCFVLLCSSAWGLQIISPKVGAVFYAGDTVTIKIKQDSGENIKMVFLGALKTAKGTMLTSPPYQYVFSIDKDFIGTETILANARLDNNKVIEARVDIQVVLPSNIALAGIRTGPNPVCLYKMPQNSNPNDIRIFETKSMAVSGTYSDGIKREITGSTSGTTYTSSDEKVVTVDKEGKVTAQGLGKAKITVRNGKFSAMVDVVVKPYKK